MASSGGSLRLFGLTGHVRGAVGPRVVSWAHQDNHCDLTMETTGTGRGSCRAEGGQPRSGGQDACGQLRTGHKGHLGTPH